MRPHLKSAQLARIKAAYRIVFGHPVPYNICQTREPGELAVQLDKAIRDMKPLDEFNSHELIYPHEETLSEPLPLSIRALARWQYMQRQ